MEAGEEVKQATERAGKAGVFWGAVGGRLRGDGPSARTRGKPRWLGDVPGEGGVQSPGGRCGSAGVRGVGGTRSWGLGGGFG